jgi:hypothetical protein
LPSTALITSVVATKHYGVAANSVYDDDLDYGEKTIISRDGRVRCKTFTWYIAIGDDLQRDAVIKFPFIRSIDYNYSDRDLIFEDVLFESTDKTAPRHRSKGESINENCTVKADLRSINRFLFKPKTDTSGNP